MFVLKVVFNERRFIMKYEVEKYLRENKNKYGKKYFLKIGGLILYFQTIKDAQGYYEKYLK